MHTDFSGGRSSGLIVPSLSEFSTVCCEPHSQRFWHSQQSRSRCFSGTTCYFDDPPDVDNLISDSSAFSKTSLNIWKFTVHILLKPGLENFEHYFLGASLVAQRIKASVYNAGDLGSIPGSGRSLEKELATHFSTLA